MMHCKLSSLQGNLRSIGSLLLRSERGAALVETALSYLFLLALLFGIAEFSLALYAYTYVSEAAREATRYASVRSTNACAILSTFPDCDLNPETNVSTTPSKLQAYVQNLGYPGFSSNNLTVTATWWTSPSGGMNNQWNVPCTTASAPACSTPGNLVRVTVNYAFPLAIPFWSPGTLNIHSTSQMVISR